MHPTGTEPVVAVASVPRTHANRLKNWRCVYPGCHEAAKTRYNCYSHIWDAHLRFRTSGAQAPAYKDVPDKAALKALCAPYMVKLVDDAYPFDFAPRRPPSAPAPDLFFEIVQVGEALKQLHVVGEIFAEAGFLTRSDATAKRCIETIHLALDKVMHLQAFSFRYAGDDRVRFGFIAQQLREEVPELVKEDARGLYIDTEGILPLLVESLKAIQQRIETYQQQTAELQALHGRVDRSLEHLQALRTALPEEQPAPPSLPSRVVAFFQRVLGPPPFLFFAALFTSVLCFVVVLVFTSFHYLITFLACLTVVLWVYVVFNWKAIRHFLRNGRSFLPSLMGWKMVEIVVWYYLFAIFLVILAVSIIADHSVYLYASLYILVAVLASFVVLLLYTNFHHFIRNRFFAVLLALIQLCAVVGLVLYILLFAEKIVI